MGLHLMTQINPKWMLIRAIEEVAGVFGIIGGTAYLSRPGRAVLQAGFTTADAASIAIVLASISTGVGVITTRLLEAYRGFLRANSEGNHAKLSTANQENAILIAGRAMDTERIASLERSIKMMAETVESQQRTIFEQQLQIAVLTKAKEAEPISG